MNGLEKWKRMQYRMRDMGYKDGIHYRVASSYFVGAITVQCDTIVDGPPILRWAVGKSIGSFTAYAKRKGWEIRPLRPADIDIH